ncbi:hypothetical protein [Moorena sp. SIO2C4]|uniref:hypothetical protein n=1 Tax=Moorena sp. SIO2C4 TaxID=2607824 RepID=UPI00257B95B6|nr:hypothetical protein [Moorena sp. SIO2C4]
MNSSRVGILPALPDLERARCPFYRCDPRVRAMPRALGGAHLLLKSFYYSATPI